MSLKNTKSATTIDALVDVNIFTDKTLATLQSEGKESITVSFVLATQT